MPTRHPPLLALILAACLAGCASPHSASLVWRPQDVGYGCDAAVTTDHPRDGDASLRLATQTKDPQAWLAFVGVRVARADAKPLATLAQLVNGGSLTIDLFRDERTGDGIPPYTLPWVALRLRNPDGEEAQLLWESPYNGYPPGKGVVPVGSWLDDLPISKGVFWMRFQGRNYNMGAGFQKLETFMAGHVTTHQGIPSLKLDPEAAITAIEIGSGPNIAGTLVMYADDVRFSAPGRGEYHMNFEPAK